MKYMTYNITYSHQYCFIFFLLIMISGCREASVTNVSQPQSTQQHNFAAPVKLGGNTKQETSENFLIKHPVDKIKIKKAIESYRISKKSSEGPLEYVGVDLNVDGSPEVLVYFTGKDWCAKTGCTLAIFRTTRFGYEPISTIRRVKSPVIISPNQTLGWHDMYVRTGIGEWQKAHRVVLKFTGQGYPGNAILMNPLSKFEKINGEEVFAGISQEDLRIGWGE